MTPEAALDYVQRHGVVLASARGPVPRLVDTIVGGPVKGSWWAHPKGRQIYALFQFLENAPEVLVCRLVEDRISFVHRRLWPALVRLAPRLPPERLARIRQVHTESGRHQNRETAFPQWVPPEVVQQARELGEAEAAAMFGPWIQKALNGTA